MSSALERDDDEYPYQILIKVISYKSGTDELSVRIGACKMGANTHQTKGPNSVTLSVAKGLSAAPDCHSGRSEGSGSMGYEILRCAQDDRAVLPAALWPTRTPVRLRLMCIWADKSAVGAVNRPLQPCRRS